MTSLVIISMHGEHTRPFTSSGLPYTHIQLSLQAAKIDIAIYEGQGNYRRRVMLDQPDRDALPWVQAAILKRLRNAREDGLLVYWHSPRIFDAVQALILESSLPYIMAFNETPSLPWTHHHFVASARDRLAFDEEALAGYRRRFLYDASYVAPGDSDEIARLIERSASRLRLAPLVKSDTTLNGLVLSYYAAPARTVAVQRVAYWAENLPHLYAEHHGGNGRIDMQMMTACESWKNDDTALVVRDLGPTDSRGLDIAQLRDELAAARVNYFAIHWADHIRAWFNARPNAHVDVVIMSGNPFYYFGLAKWFKARFGAQVILDFRDPFSDNPRFTYTPAHKALVNRLEDEFIAASDAVLTVNDHCLDHLRIGESDTAIVVANGFDERIVDAITPKSLKRSPSDKGKQTFIYTGKFYTDRDASHFIGGLAPERQRFIHIGWSAEADSALDQYPAMERWGLMDYEDVVAHCYGAHAGVIFASGDAFEQTTKIFDYIAADLDIVIVTDGEPRTGGLHAITEDLKGIHWVRNTPDDVAEFVRVYKPRRKTRRPQRDRFSRGGASRALVELLPLPKN